MPAPTLNEYKVPLASKVPANYGDPVELFVREYNGTKTNKPPLPVLMLHGRSVPALPGFDLAPVPGGSATRYSWAQELADDGYDVFIMDLQGSGRSTRPKVMDEACNANPAQQQQVLVPHPLTELCPPPPPYAHELGNSESDWAELDKVVAFIQNLPGRNKPIRFIGWSAAAFVMGPYTLQNPGKVESLLLLAPMFPPKGRWSQKPAEPFGRPMEAGTLPVSKPPNMFGFPMNVGSMTGVKASLASTPDLWEPGIPDLVWAACMANDALGSKWGPEVAGAPGTYEGVLRYRNTYWWGWNNQTVPYENPAGTRVLGERVPVLIVYGDADRTANSPATFPDVLRFSVPDLYAAVPGPQKLMFCLAGAGHSLVWERTAKPLHHMSKQWCKNHKVEGLTSGSWFRDFDGELTPVQ
ncbi:alpha/beta hydrolase [Streptomyces sp. NPDC101169]|uniref:alpha/beta hydrolase n=1 Tax=Streptomyces sp. NPDC101169 TaxID=3366121 RepID=UPI003808256F